MDFVAVDIVAYCSVYTKVVHGSIFIQPNPSSDRPNPINPTHYKWENLDPTQPNTINSGAYTVVRFSQTDRSTVKSNLTAWCNQILSNRALKALT